MTYSRRLANYDCVSVYGTLTHSLLRRGNPYFNTENLTTCRYIIYIYMYDAFWILATPNRPTWQIKSHVYPYLSRIVEVSSALRRSLLPARSLYLYLSSVYTQSQVYTLVSLINFHSSFRVTPRPAQPYQLSPLLSTISYKLQLNNTTGNPLMSM